MLKHAVVRKECDSQDAPHNGDVEYIGPVAPVEKILFTGGRKNGHGCIEVVKKQKF